MTPTPRKPAAQAFSLVEVILAIGVFALTIVAVIGLLGPIAQQVRDLRDAKVANSLPGPIREEMNRLGFNFFVDEDLTAAREDVPPLFATPDGAEVGLEADIEPEQRYFLIELTQPEDPGTPDPGDPDVADLSYQPGDAHVTYQVTISWPYILPDGSGTGVEVAPEDRQSFSYYSAIVVGEPF